LPESQLASLMALIPPPLGVGKVQLASGNLVVGFICEAYATATAADITSYGGWRSYMRHSAAP
jgi:allophanate hydrolase